MGNVFYSLLSLLHPFEDLEATDMQEKVINGERPDLTMFDNIISSNSADEDTRRATKALVEAIRLCWKQDADKRPSAKEILAVLEG